MTVFIFLAEDSTEKEENIRSECISKRKKKTLLELYNVLQLVEKKKIGLSHTHTPNTKKSEFQIQPVPHLSIWQSTRFKLGEDMMRATRCICNNG